MNEKGNRRTYRMHLSAGIERALYLAAEDPAFREALTAERAAAAERAGIQLSGSERGMLGAIPEGQLQAAIDGVDTTEDNLRRRSFLRAVAVSAAALSVGQPLGRCTRAESKPPPVDYGVPKDVPQYYPDMGVRPSPDIGPDMPQVAVDGGGPDMGVRPSDITVDVPQYGVDSKGVQPDWVPWKPDVAVDVPGFNPDHGINTDVRPHDVVQPDKGADKGLPDPDDNGGGCNMVP